MNKNLKIALIAIFVVAFLLFISYIILKNTFGINKTGSGSVIRNFPFDVTQLENYNGGIAGGILINSPEDLSLRTMRAATGQNAI